MGLDPTSFIAGLATNFASDIIEHYAQQLDRTPIGQGLKKIGLTGQARNDHLREILKEALQLYFNKWSIYDISGVTDFFFDSVTTQQISNYIFNHQPVEVQVLVKSLNQHLKNDPYSLMLLRQRGGNPEQIIPNFLFCYRQVLNEHTNAPERAILLSVFEATDTVVAEIHASEERRNAFAVEVLRQQRGGEPSLSPGQVFGQYRLQRQLAKTMLGTLYLAEQQHTGANVVFKVVNTPGGLRLGRDMFALGTRLMKLSHPSILPTLEVKLEGIFPYVVTAYATGGSLYERIKSDSSQMLSLSEKLKAFSQVGDALAYLHKENIIHRGVQPRSILFDSMGNALLTGFDLAITTDMVVHRLPSNRVGAENYMAPEQFQGIISKKTDQYALGCVAYELCTGHLPFKQQAFLSPSTHPIKQPIAPHSLNHQISSQVERAILKALSIKPEQRFEDISLFVKAMKII